MEIHTLRLTFNDRVIAVLPNVALPVTHRFNRKFFHRCALLCPQRYCQGHGAFNAASHGNQLFREVGSTSCMPR